ncbi:MAG: class I SAM-dependent methyltransferase [Candidatus Methanofastidiosia archaeon]
MGFEPKELYVRKAISHLRQCKIPIVGFWIDGGSGFGAYSLALSHLGASFVIAIDRDHHRLSHIAKSEKISILACRGDCRRLPIKDDCVDGFLLVNVLHYYTNPIDFCIEASRVLRSGGHLIVVEYEQHFSVPWNPFPLDVSGIEDLFLKSGFEIKRTLLIDIDYRPKHLVVGELKE